MSSSPLSLQRHFVTLIQHLELSTIKDKFDLSTIKRYIPRDVYNLFQNFKVDRKFCTGLLITGHCLSLYTKIMYVAQQLNWLNNIESVKIYILDIHFKILFTLFNKYFENQRRLSLFS